MWIALLGPGSSEPRAKQPQRKFISRVYPPSFDLRASLEEDGIYHLTENE